MVGVFCSNLHVVCAELEKIHLVVGSVLRYYLSEPNVAMWLVIAHRTNSDFHLEQCKMPPGIGLSSMDDTTLVKTTSSLTYLI